jgi:hypothetical protein
MDQFLQEVTAGRIYTFPTNKYVSLWITDDPFGSGHAGSPYFKVKYKRMLVSVSLPELKVLQQVKDSKLQEAVEMALEFAETRVEILTSRYQDAIQGRVPAPIE